MYEIREGINKVLSSAKAKFNESIDVVFALDRKVVKQSVRGVIDLPHLVSSDVEVGAFVKSDLVDECKKAGAKFVGDEDLIQSILDGARVQCDWFVTTPDFMPKVAKLSKILGPKGLMPNPKFGTVTTSVVETIEKLKSGRIKFKSDSYALVHIKVGDVKFTVDALEENIVECANAVKGLSAVDGKPLVIQAMHLSSTMGEGSVKLKVC